MPSMYEQIMNFPLFKGISKDHVSMILAKTNITFNNYKAGDKVVSSGCECHHIGFIARGTLRCTYASPDGQVKIGYNLSAGDMIGADALFGIDRTFPTDIQALATTSILTFAKEEYMNLLREDEIFLMNYLNHISLRSQCGRIAVGKYEAHGIAGLIARWLLTMTSQRCKEIQLEIAPSLLDILPPVYASSAADDVKLLAEKGVIAACGDRIDIPDRWKYLDFVDENE